MRTLWSVVSFLAVVHLLALLIFIAWLWRTQRLDGDRVRDLKHTLAMTIPQAQQAVAQAEAQADEQARQQREELDFANPPANSAAQIERVALVRFQEQQARRRLDDERRMLMQQLAASIAQVEQRKAALDKEHQSRQTALAQNLQRKSDEQFLQTVRQYEQVTPKQGKRMIVELINKQQIDQAVAYLDAMSPRSAARILKEFKTDPEIGLATQLLEKLRTFGLDVDQAANNAAPPAADRFGAGPASGPSDADGAPSST